MLGIILCGGQSSRMGTDKGLLTTKEKTWAKASAEKLAALDLPVKISINQNQYPGYASDFSETDLIPDDPLLSINGPLLGLLSCHLKYPADDLFILACDMPMMETTLLFELYSGYRRQSPASAYVFTNNGEWEPLCGIYTASGLTHILKLLQSGQLSKHSMKNMLGHLQVYSIALRGDQKKAFLNINSLTELNGLSP